MVFRFTPTARAQIALWIEKADGTFMSTVRLTQATSLRGIGNRPGATQMNSGFRWPYGRREGTLPIWAHRRASAPGAAQFRRVIFQNRRSEGMASISLINSDRGSDSTPERYFCLSFDEKTTRRDALDAVTCASAFMSDKGRFLTSQDQATKYSEPVEVAGQAMNRPLDFVSLYPPRRDVGRCEGLSSVNCYDHEDLALFREHAKQVMPEIDAVTMATPAANAEQMILFTVPADTATWPNGEYVAWAEVNVEGDYNTVFNDKSYPTPIGPDGAWDSWAITFGYPYRGQPSVVYKVPFTLGPSAEFSAAAPVGFGPVDGFEADAGAMRPIDNRITDNPAGASGSGADRLLLMEGTSRLHVKVIGEGVCRDPGSPASPGMVRVAPVADEKNSHQWGTLHFVVPPSTRPIDHYDVRYSKSPITDGDLSSFMSGMPAVAASLDSEQLKVPTNRTTGSAIDVHFGGLEPLTRYWVAIRAVDICNSAGPFAVAELTTSRINFTQLAGCFVATAAYGSSLEEHVASFRTVRDYLRPRSVVAATAVDLYYRAGPAAAELLSASDTAKALVRTLLGPVAAVSAGLAKPLSPDASVE